MLQALYTLVLRLLVPLVCATLWWRGRRHPGRRVDLRERLGRSTATLSRGQAPVWIHAVSVGEVQAAAQLIALLAARVPQQPLLLTMATATGRQRATALYASYLTAHEGRLPLLQLRYAPFDLPGSVARFLAEVQPCAGLILEAELWPNLLRACARRGVPVALVSARLSVRSQRRYRSFALGLLQRSLRGLLLIATQTAADAQRFIELGASADRVQVAGNLKFDLQLPADLPQQAARLRQQCLGDRRLWVAGSTHAGEEEQLLAAQRLLWEGAAAPGPLLVLAPRHPERFAAVAQLLERSGLTFVRYSDGDAAVAAHSAQVLLLDTLGDLLTFYACCEAAFVGGSLVPLGGHNLLEPAALGKPVLSGPAYFSAPEAARLLLDCGALQVVADGPALAAALQQCLADPQTASRRGMAGLAVIEANRGAAARTVALLQAHGLLPVEQPPA
jgi:3-deoxy-D-manno-octulosonic-acid transferase